jgi:hypothetical protein
VEPDPEDRELLDHNIAQAEAAFRDAPDFETAARALSGWREALHQRLDAQPKAHAIEAPVVVTHADGTPIDPPGGGTVTWPIDPKVYWHSIPQRFRDRDRFHVSRTITLSLGAPVPEAVNVYDREGVLVWTKDHGRGRG